MLSHHAGLGDLPGIVTALFADPAEDLFASRAWYATLIAHGLPGDVRPLFAVCCRGGAPFGLLPLARCTREEKLRSLTGLYTCGFRPLLAAAANAFEVGVMIGRFCRSVPVARLDAIDGEAPWFKGFVSGLRHAGLSVRPFDFFGNWVEPVLGRSFGEYLAARPGALKATVRRKLHRAEGAMGFTVVTGGEELEGAISDYEAVYARSWKEPEPFPELNPALMRVTAALGLLRLGVLRISGQAAALQFWVISGGRASVLKLAHDEAFARYSPGTLLTARMIEHLLDHEKIRELDFGRGDDPYKRLWTSERRQRIGLILANPRRVRGLVEIARSLAGAGRRRVRGALARPSASMRRDAHPL